MKLSRRKFLLLAAGAAALRPFLAPHRRSTNHLHPNRQVAWPHLPLALFGRADEVIE
jgi:hypothetical protein